LLLIYELHDWARAREVSGCFSALGPVLWTPVRATENR
jgi:hypothetical protein